MEFPRYLYFLKPHTFDSYDRQSSFEVTGAMKIQSNRFSQPPKGSQWYIPVTKMDADSMERVLLSSSDIEDLFNKGIAKEGKMVNGVVENSKPLVRKLFTFVRDDGQLLWDGYASNYEQALKKASASNPQITSDTKYTEEDPVSIPNMRMKSVRRESMKSVKDVVKNILEGKDIRSSIMEDGEYGDYTPSDKAREIEAFMKEKWEGADIDITTDDEGNEYVNLGMYWLSSRSEGTDKQERESAKAEELLDSEFDMPVEIDYDEGPEGSFPVVGVQVLQYNE